MYTGVSHHRLERILWVFARSEIQISKFQDSGMSGDGIRGLLNLAGASMAAPDKLSDAWANFPEADRAALGNGALERITKVLEDMKYNPNEEFAIFAKDAGEFGTQSVQSHLPSNLGMRDLVSFRNFLKLMVQQHWITEPLQRRSLTQRTASSNRARFWRQPLPGTSPSWLPLLKNWSRVTSCENW